jgi:hypothetical protein
MMWEMHTFIYICLCFENKPEHFSSANLLHTHASWEIIFLSNNKYSVTADRKKEGDQDDDEDDEEEAEDTEESLAMPIRTSEASSWSSG